MTRIPFTLLAFGIFVMQPGSTFAQHAEEAQTESHEEHFHPNHISLFLGATSELKDEKDVHSTAGVDYVRKLGANGTWGAGGFGEAIFKDQLEGLLGAHVYWYAIRGFWLMAGAGIEFHLSETQETAAKAENESDAKREVSPLIRTGIGYNFELGGFSVGPAVFLDTLRDTESLVWGINIGKGF